MAKEPAESITSITDLTDALRDVADTNERVTVDTLLDTIGRRSFGPVLLCIGLVMLVPGVSDIPGVPTILGVLIILIVGQIMLGLSHVWLPKWVLNRSVKGTVLKKTLSYTKKPVHFIDKFVGGRLAVLVNFRVTWYLVGLASMTIAIGTPLLELIPFSANVAGLSIFLFGLALVARDGVVLILAFTVYLLTSGIVGYVLF